jgi:cyclophilin family peptidyl-prolyl cis-trans isomerase
LPINFFLGSTQTVGLNGTKFLLHLNVIKIIFDMLLLGCALCTGPGPAPQLDNGNIVFGTILEGMDVVSAISTVPTYKPSSRIRQFNNFAELLGDDRAANARSLWNKPLKAIVIKSCGVMDIARKFS